MNFDWWFDWCQQNISDVGVQFQKLLINIIATDLESEDVLNLRHFPSLPLKHDDGKKDEERESESFPLSSSSSSSSHVNSFGHSFESTEIDSILISEEEKDKDKDKEIQQKDDEDEDKNKDEDGKTKNEGPIEWLNDRMKILLFISSSRAEINGKEKFFSLQNIDFDFVVIKFIRNADYPLKL